MKKFIAGFAGIAMVLSLVGSVASDVSAQAAPGAESALTQFNIDLSVGSTGTDVAALQTILVTQGYLVMPAGVSKGTFGPLTQAAVAKWQASVGITPAAGYFGPISRAKLNSMAMISPAPTVPGCPAGAMFNSITGAKCGTSTTLPAGCSSTAGYSVTTGAKCDSSVSSGSGSTLSGGEADIDNNFDLKSGDDLSEGDSGTEIAIATFDVKDADANLQRVTLEFQPIEASANANEHPWEYIDTLSVYNGNTKIGEVDAGSKSDWSSDDADSDHNTTLDLDVYSIDIPVKGLVSDGDKVELSIRADAQGTIDSDDIDQTFNIDIPDNGIRAVDGAGIQEYTGDVGDEVTLGFDDAQNGDLTVRKSSDTPDAGVIVADSSSTSDEFTVFNFEIKNSDDSDSNLNSLTVRVASTSTSGSAGDITDIIRKATLTVDGDTFDGDINADNTIDFDDLDVTLAGNDTTSFELSIELYSQSGNYASSGQTLTFSVVGSSDVDAEGSDTGDASDVSGTATGNRQSISLNAGINVAGNPNSTVLTYNSNSPNSSYGTFTLKFDVTASGDTVYVPKTVVATSTGFASSTAGVIVDTGLSASTAGLGGAMTASMTTSADSDNGNFYVVNDGDIETFTVKVTIDPSATGDYQVGLDKVRFSTVDTDLNSLQTLDVDQTDSEFQTESLHIPNA